MNIILFGCNGEMGQTITKSLENDLNRRIIFGVDKSPDKKIHTYPIYQDVFESKEAGDILIDFSHPYYLAHLIKYAIKENCPVVIATTGYDENQFNQIKEAAKKVPVFYASNMSLGINILHKMLKAYSTILSENYDVGIIEKHHSRKVDAPSGTAKYLAEIFKHQCPMHSLRMGTIVGEHQVIFAGKDEIIELKHTALSKEIFAEGALKAAEFLILQEQGFYTMDDLF